MLTLRKCSHRDLEKYYSIFEMDFDSDELLPKLSIHKAMLRGEQELIAMYDEESGMDIACALVCTKSLYGYVLLKYFSVLPWYRDRGLALRPCALLISAMPTGRGLLPSLPKLTMTRPNT